MRRRRPFLCAVMRGITGNRDTAAVQVRDLAANTLEAAAAALRHAHQDHRVRDLVERALRRLSRTADFGDSALKVTVERIDDS